METTSRLSTGTWKSIAPEVRPSALKNADGTLKPFYLSRTFELSDSDVFHLQIANYADPLGKITLANIGIRGHVEFAGDHPIISGAQKANFTADIDYQVSPENPAFADILNKIAVEGYNKWEVGKSQSIFKRTFAPFGLAKDQVFKEYDLIYINSNMMFWGARHVDGRGFDTEGNRPLNLQIPMIRVQ